MMVYLLPNRDKLRNSLLYKPSVIKLSRLRTSIIQFN